MKIRYCMHKKSEFRSGFILYEVLIYILVASLVIVSLNSNLFLTKKIITQEPDQLLIWHDAMLRLEDNLYQAEVIKYEKNKFIFKSGPNSRKPGKKYILEQYRDMLRMTGIQGGHAPILMNLKSIKIKVIGSEFYLWTITKKGQEFEYIVPIKKS